MIKASRLRGLIIKQPMLCNFVHTHTHHGWKSQFGPTGASVRGSVTRVVMVGVSRERTGSAGSKKKRHARSFLLSSGFAERAEVLKHLAPACPVLPGGKWSTEKKDGEKSAPKCCENSTMGVRAMTGKTCVACVDFKAAWVVVLGGPRGPGGN